MSQVGSLQGGQSQLMQEIGIRILAKTQDAARQQGDAAVSLLEAASHLQKNLGTSSAGTGGSGSNLSHAFGTVGSVLDVTG